MVPGVAEGHVQPSESLLPLHQNLPKLTGHEFVGAANGRSTPPPLLTILPPPFTLPSFWKSQPHLTHRFSVPLPGSQPIHTNTTLDTFTSTYDPNAPVQRINMITILTQSFLT